MSAFAERARTDGLVRATAGVRGRSDGPGGLLSLIRAMGGATRRDLMRATHLARATVDSRLDTLSSHGFVVSREVVGTTGRPPQMFEFNETGGYLFCIDMGSTHTRLGIADLGGRLMAHTAVDLDLTMGPGVALGKVGTLLREMVRTERIDARLVLGVGVGVPSPVELTGHMVRLPFDGRASAFAEWTEMVISREIRAFLPALGVGDIPVEVDKDANNMAVGEWRTSWPEVRDLIVLKVGMTLSCGIVANSDIVRGAIGVAGDLGHIPDSTSDVLCRCGQRGCAEATASGRGIVKLLDPTAGSVRTSRELVRLQRSGRSDVVELMKQAGHRLGVLVGSAISTLNPQLVVVGGDLAEGNDLLLDEIRSVALARVHPLTAASTRIVRSRISDEAGLYGAAHLALRRVLDPASVDLAIDQGRRLSVKQVG